MRPGVVGGGIGAVIIALIALFFGVDPGAITTDDPMVEGVPSEPYVASPEEQHLADFVSVVLASTEDTWHEVFQNTGSTYQEPTLVLFSGAVQSACGMGQAAMGPFYCPADQQVYIDLSFYRELEEQFQAPGDFAQAYVVAHEVGHHVQNLLGVASQISSIQQQVSREEANALSVRMELQADCFAGVWASRLDENGAVRLERGDVEEGLNAAAAIGDDRLQKQAQGYVVPESFTHGSSAERVQWFQRGLESGRPEACDTF